MWRKIAYAGSTVQPGTLRTNKHGLSSKFLKKKNEGRTKQLVYEHGLQPTALDAANNKTYCLVMCTLSLELCRCFSDIFFSSRPHTGWATACITGDVMTEARSVNVKKNTHTHTHTRGCFFLMLCPGCHVYRMGNRVWYIMVEARSVYVKNTQTHAYGLFCSSMYGHHI